jgi:hypothetical protein
MSRADIPAEERTPFYLYVDEFQNFATDSFATILSEARKYGLNLTVANQYIAQMSIEVKDAVFGNVGSIIAFRMGADDAGTMQRYFEPQFLEHDLVHMHNRHFVVSMTIEGEKVPAFSAVTLNLPPLQLDETDNIINHSRSLYASSRGYVEKYVGERYLLDTNNPYPTTPISPAQPTTPQSSQPVQPPIKTTNPTQPPEPPLVVHSQMVSDAVGQSVSQDDESRPKRHRSRRRRHSSTSNTLERPASSLRDLAPEDVIDLKE